MILKSINSSSSSSSLTRGKVTRVVRSWDVVLTFFTKVLGNFRTLSRTRFSDVQFLSREEGLFLNGGLAHLKVFNTKLYQRAINAACCVTVDGLFLDVLFFSVVAMVWGPHFGSLACGCRISLAADKWLNPGVFTLQAVWTAPAIKVVSNTFTPLPPPPPPQPRLSPKSCSSTLPSSSSSISSSSSSSSSSLPSLLLSSEEFSTSSS